MRRAAATLAGLACLASAPAAAHATPRAILSAVNYEREMAGLKPITTRSDWAAACGAHTAYMNASGDLSHTEALGARLFSEQGAWAGAHSVLARSSTGFSGNPWRSAPFHQFQVLHPWLRETGISITGGYACMITLGERDAPNPDAYGLATVPATAQFTRPAEVAHETPFTPGDEVGLPQGTKTGPHIFVYAHGPERLTTVTIEAASLTAMDDGAPVALKWVDGTSPRSGRFLDGGAILIPATPLREGTTYGLRVEAATTASNGSRLRISRTSSFITGPDESDLVQTPEADTVTAASARGAGSPTGAPGGTTRVRSSKVKRGAPAVIGSEGQPQLEVSLRWTGAGIKANIHCASAVSRCEGPLRVLVRRKGRKVQKLRFVARGGPLKVRLAPGRTITRRLNMTKRQRASGRKRGFAVRWGAPAPERARALEVG